MQEIYGKRVCTTLEEVLDPSRCGVVVVDVQNDAMKPDGAYAQTGLDISSMIEVLPRIADFIDLSRSAKVPLFHIQTLTLPEGRSDSPAWLRTKQSLVGSTEWMLPGSWGAEICEECKPLDNEPVIVKHRSSAFRQTALDQYLRAAGVETVVVVGEQTPGCVEATFRDAAYHDYYNVLVEDCVAGFDRELHEASLKIQRARHDVCTANVIKKLWL